MGWGGVGLSRWKRLITGAEWGGVEWDELEWRRG